VWCGAVVIADFNKVLLRPGNYSCRVEEFSAQESYLEFGVADGGIYYLVVDCDPSNRRPDGGWLSMPFINCRPELSFATVAGAVDMWNMWMQSHQSGKTDDLTKVDSEAFRKLHPSCASSNNRNRSSYQWIALPSGATFGSGEANRKIAHSPMFRISSEVRSTQTQDGSILLVCEQTLPPGLR